MTTMNELEIALNDKGWEPEYCEEFTTTGETLIAPVFEIVVDDNLLINVELTEVDTDDEIIFARVWQADDIMDIDDVGSVDAILNEIKQFVDGI